jgi:hypothetical protein
LFEYNSERLPSDILAGFGKTTDTEAKLVLHPSVEEYFAARRNGPVPIGV